MNVVILGARERRIRGADRRHVEQLIARLLFDHGANLTVASAGCDAGINKMVFETCQKAGIKLAEDRVFFYAGENYYSLKDRMDAFEKREVFRFLAARNQWCLTVGDEFHFYTGHVWDGIVERLIEPARMKVNESRVHIYPEGLNE